VTEILQRYVSPETLETARHLLEIYGIWLVLGLGLVVGLWQPLAPDYLIVAAALLGRSPYPLALAAALATGAGALIGYYLGRRIGTPVLARMFRSRPHHLERMERMFHRYGVLAVTICAATPIPMKYALWMSGALRLSPPRYMAALYLGYLPRLIVVAALSRSLAGM
jgi:membrane protein YqaA with SNARE-associated domain